MVETQKTEPGQDPAADSTQSHQPDSPPTSRENGDGLEDRVARLNINSDDEDGRRAGMPDDGTMVAAISDGGHPPDGDLDEGQGTDNSEPNYEGSTNSDGYDESEDFYDYNDDDDENIDTTTTTTRNDGDALEYTAYSTRSLTDRRRYVVERSNQILLPEGALHKLLRRQVAYPMMFRIENRGGRTCRYTHCGVLEFSADSNRCYLPVWLMRNLCLADGDALFVTSVSLQKGAYAKFHIEPAQFFRPPDPKSILENRLRYLACLSVGDTVPLFFNGRNYEIRVMETKPDDAIIVINCDLEVDIVTSRNELNRPTKKARCDDDTTDNTSVRQQEELDFAPPEITLPQPKRFRAFGTNGARLDGKDDQPFQSLDETVERGVPDPWWNLGRLKFIRMRSQKMNATVE